MMELKLKREMAPEIGRMEHEEYVPESLIYTFNDDLTVGPMRLWHTVHNNAAFSPSKITLFADGRLTFLYRISNSSHHAKFNGFSALFYKFNTSTHPVPELPRTTILSVDMSHDRHTYYKEFQGENALYHHYVSHFSWLKDRPDIDAFIYFSASRIA